MDEEPHSDAQHRRTAPLFATDTMAADITMLDIHVRGTHIAARRIASRFDVIQREAILMAIARRLSHEILGPGAWGFEHIAFLGLIADGGDVTLRAGERGDSPT